MRAITRIGAALAGLGVLAGCAVTYPGPNLGSPVSTPDTATPTPTPPNTARPTGAAEEEFVAEGRSPQVMDGDLLGSLLARIETRTTYNGTRVFASWPQFDRSPVDAQISGYFTQAISDFEAIHPAAASGVSAELNLGWQLIGSSPEAVGVVSDGYLFDGADGRSSWRSFWFDPATGAVLGTDELLDHAAALAALRDAAAAHPDVDLGRAGDDPLAAAPMVAFTGQGELIVGFDQCQVMACSHGRVTLTVPAAATAPLLTDEGRRVEDSVVNPVRPDAVTASPTPTPTTTPTPTGKPGGAARKVDCDKVKCVALSFDDGPGPYTRTLLAHLADAKAPATFFLLGQQVETYPKVARAVARAGHEIGVHTWDHRDLTKLSPAQIDRELTSTIRVLRRDAGVNPRYLRPPYGAMDADVHASAKRSGLALVLWNVDTLDWLTRDTDKTVAAAVKRARRGSIILLHDIHPATVKAVPAIIRKLRAKGFTLVTVSTLLGRTKPGVVYSHGR